MTIKLDKEKIEKNNITNRYIHGQLSPEETIAFEEYLMEHSEMIEDLQLDQMFVESMGNIEVEKHNNERTAPTFAFWPSISWLGLGAIGAYASVALFSLVFTGGTATLMNIDRVVYVDTLRSSEPVKRHITLGEKTEKMVLMLSAGFGQKGPFDISIVNESTNKVIAEFKSVPKTETDDIAIVVDMGLFEVGRYLFNVKSSDENNMTSALIEFTR